MLFDLQSKKVLIVACRNVFIGNGLSPFTPYNKQIK